MATINLADKQSLNKIGDVYTRWTIIATAEPAQPRNKTRWLCRCVCGVERIIRATHLRAGMSKSCGCLCRDETIKTHTKHGLCGTGTYHSWTGMKRRCSNPNDLKYAWYGGRGIKVCERWNDFTNFLADMGLKPEGTSLDRIDFNGDYTPENCRWLECRLQNRNTSFNRMIEINGVSKCVSEWCEIYQIPHGRVQGRLDTGWLPIDAFTAPSDRSAERSRRPRDIDGMRGDRPNAEKWANGIVHRRTLGRRIDMEGKR